MKKIFRLMLAVAAVASVVSCAKEAAIPAGEEVEVSFVANLAGAPGSRAIADGTTVDEVAYAIYESGSTTPTSLKGTLVLENKKATLNTRLVAGKIYDIAFFAYKKDDTNGKPLHYTIDWSEQTVTMNITAKTKANDETLDCFWHVATDIDVKQQDEYDFTLTRPLAQLNLGVTPGDIEAARKAGFSVTDTQITVNTYTQFNMFTGELTEQNPINVTFDRADSPIDADNEVLVIEKDSNVYEYYKYLATTYILVGEKKVTSDVSVTLWANDGNVLNTLNYSFVPFQRNYRTNILGELLTNPATFSIVVDEKFANDFNGPDFQ